MRELKLLILYLIVSTSFLYIRSQNQRPKLLNHSYQRKRNTLKYKKFVIFHACYQVLNLLSEEGFRNTQFLHQSSFSKANKACQNRLIFDHIEFLQAGCTEMIKTSAKDGIWSFWNVFIFNFHFCLKITNNWWIFVRRFTSYVFTFKKWSKISAIYGRWSAEVYLCGRSF